MLTYTVIITLVATHTSTTTFTINNVDVSEIDSALSITLRGKKLIIDNLDANEPAKKYAQQKLTNSQLFNENDYETTSIEFIREDVVT